jgi:hypothetical protein
MNTPKTKSGDEYAAIRGDYSLENNKKAVPKGGFHCDG